jgi:glycosyltransferase involved in cell wall biosynthesis
MLHTGKADEARKSRPEGADALPRVTIVINTFNDGAFLPEAIASALAQEGAILEVLVVDDGSRDDPTSIVAEYLGVRLVRQKNQGLAGARNTGAREAGGTFILFLDADDRLLPGAVAANLELFERRPECALVHGTYRSVDKQWLPIWHPAPFDLGEDPLRSLLREGNRIGMHATVMYRRDRLLELGGFDASLRANEDYDLYLRMARRFPMASGDHVAAEYRHHDANMSRNCALMLTSALEVLDRQRAVLSERPELAATLVHGRRFMRAYWARAQLRQLARAMVRRRRIASHVAAVARFATTAPLAFAHAGLSMMKEILHGKRRGRSHHRSSARREPGRF